MKTLEHENMKTKNFKDELKHKMDHFVHLVYRVTRKFPHEEIYGVTSQLRRAALSIILNYIEGYARRRAAVQLNFFEIAYGSLKESKYLLHFSMSEQFVSKEDYKEGIIVAEEIGAMLWTEIEALQANTSAGR